MHATDVPVGDAAVILSCDRRERRPARPSTASTFSTARSAIAVRVSVVPLPRCGTQQDVLERQQIGVNGRLVLVHVERRAGEQPVLERPGERRLVDDRAARRVDQVRGSLHPREGALVDQVTRVWSLSGTCSDTTSDVLSSRSSDIATQRRRDSTSRRDVYATRIPNAGARAATARRDPAEPDEPELLAAQLGAEHEVERPALATRRAEPAARLPTSRRVMREDQRPREVGDRLGQHVRRIGDDDAAGRARKPTSMLL